MATPMTRNPPQRAVEPPPSRQWGLVAGVSGTMAVARLLDLGSTRVLDAALGGEQNPLHQLFGAGLGTLVAVNVVLVALLAALFASSVWLDARMRPEESGLGLRAFLSAFLF